MFQGPGLFHRLTSPQLCFSTKKSFAKAQVSTDATVSFVLFSVPLLITGAETAAVSTRYMQPFFNETIINIFIFSSFSFRDTLGQFVVYYLIT